jgi:hypothetical protein
MQKYGSAVALAAATVVLGFGASGASALDALPWTFVGTRAECGTRPGSSVATAEWISGIGLSESGISQAIRNRNDEHVGLLLSKNALTSNCSSAGVSIEGWTPGQPVTRLGFAYRLGGHCGAGAPRFNIRSTAGYTYFAGCAHGRQGYTGQDTQWRSVRFTPTEGAVYPADPSAPSFSFGPTGTPVESIKIVFDEGTDAATSDAPAGIGLAVLDSILIGSEVIKHAPAIETATAAK